MYILYNIHALTVYWGRGRGGVHLVEGYAEGKPIFCISSTSIANMSELPENDWAVLIIILN